MLFLENYRQLEISFKITTSVLIKSLRVIDIYGAMYLKL